MDPVTRYYREMRYLEGLDTLHHHTKSMYDVDNHVGNQLHLIKSNASGSIDPLMKSAFMLEIENLRSKSRGWCSGLEQVRNEFKAQEKIFKGKVEFVDLELNPPGRL